MVRWILGLILVAAGASSLSAQEAAAKFMRTLQSQRPESGVVHVIYDCRGKFLGEHFPSDDAASSAQPKDLTFESSMLELWLDPQNKRFRKHYRASELDLSGERPALLDSEQDLVYVNNEIVRRAILPNEGFEYQKGTGATVVTAIFRDATDLPIYAAYGFPELTGKLRFYRGIDDSGVQLRELSSGDVLLTSTGDFNTKTEVVYSQRMEVRETRFYSGNVLNVACVVLESELLDGVRIPSKYSYTRFGATENDILETGIRTLDSAAIEPATDSAVFSQDIPVGSLVLDDASPRTLKKAGEKDR